MLCKWAHLLFGIKLHIFSNMFIVRRDTGQNYTIPTTVWKATSVLKWPIFYLINKMVTLRINYKCDWFVMQVKSSNDAEESLHEGRPQTFSPVNSDNVNSPTCRKNSPLQILKNFHPQWFRGEGKRTAFKDVLIYNLTGAVQDQPDNCSMNSCVY